MHSRRFSLIFPINMRSNNLETVLTVVCVLYDFFAVHNGLGKQQENNYIGSNGSSL
jgi:hypothetical protein